MKTKDLGGRPNKFTKQRGQKIIESIAKEIPYKLAAEANGICEDTLYTWLKQGYKDLAEGIQTEFSDFSEAVKRTEQEKIHDHLNAIKGQTKNWQARAWILERRWRTLFGLNGEEIEKLQTQLDLISKRLDSK